MFNSARLNLTLWYTLIFIAISVLISGVIFTRVSRDIAQEYHRFERKFDIEVPNAPQPLRSFARQVVAEQLTTTRVTILTNLVFLNAFIAVTIFLGGYWLSGLTLKPIAENMKEQERFISDAAHEFKTPLTALKSSIEVALLDPSFPKKARAVLESNLQDVENLQALLTTLFSLSEGPHTKFTLEKVEVKPTIERAVAQFAFALEKKKLLVTVEAQKNQFVKADADVLFEVWLILLDNAIKFSPQAGQILIQAKRSGSKIIVRVLDQGPGVSKQHSNLIFERFFQVDPARSRAESSGASFGLGLPLARKLLKRINGSVCICPPPAKNAHTEFQGACFQVTLAAC